MNPVRCAIVSVVRNGINLSMMVWVSSAWLNYVDALGRLAFCRDEIWFSRALSQSSFWKDQYARAIDVSYKSNPALTFQSLRLSYKCSRTLTSTPLFFTSSHTHSHSFCTLRNISVKMQFTKVFITVLATAIAATAAPQASSVSTAIGATSTGSPCTAGTATCCTTVTTPGNATQTLGEGILDGILGALSAPLVAIGCSAISVIGSEWSVIFWFITWMNWSWIWRLYSADTPVCCAPNTLGKFEPKLWSNELLDNCDIQVKPLSVLAAFPLVLESKLRDCKSDGELMYVFSCP